MIRALIAWMVRRTDWWDKYFLTSWSDEEGRHYRVGRRYAPFFQDEVQRGDDTIYLPLPWWAPFNALLHHWRTHDDGDRMHDHPRWSVTICLRGELIEKTPWGERRLRPGAIVFRSTRYIHGFRVQPEHSWRTWTLFIVGRRVRPQNTYRVTRRTQTPIRRESA